jgi:hypothetical protein
VILGKRLKLTWPARLAALSFDAKPVRLRDYLPTIPETHSICVFVGAMAHGCVGAFTFSLTLH